MDREMSGKSGYVLCVCSLPYNLLFKPGCLRGKGDSTINSDTGTVGLNGHILAKPNICGHFRHNPRCYHPNDSSVKQCALPLLFSTVHVGGREG